MRKYIGFLFLIESIYAHPVAFKDAMSVMSYNTTDSNELYSHYSLTNRFSVGAKFLRLKNNENSYSLLPQVSLLAYRWNHQKFQANIFTFGGFGTTWAKNKNGTVGYAGTEIDIEDRRLYFSSQFEAFIFSKLKNQYDYKTRIGFAPYLSDFNEIGTWLMLQYDFKPSAQEEHSVTPLFRVYYKNFLMEAGANLRGGGLLNFMTHF